MAEPVWVTVEFFGVPRARADRAELRVRATTIGEALQRVVEQCPRLNDLVGANERLPGHYLLSLDGRVFLNDLQLRLTDGQRLLLLSADVGG